MDIKVKFTSFFMRYLLLLVAFIMIVEGLAFVAIHFFPYTDAWKAFALVFVVSAGLAAYFAHIIASNIRASINKIIGVVHAIENGEKIEPLTFARKDEFVELGEAVNRMLDRDKAIRDANEDPLTGLANRRYFMQRLEKAMSRKAKLAVMFIDLDGFKPINDDFGHDVGDEALRIIADRLRACVRESDVLSRLGGDEFIMMFTGLNERKVLEERADKVLEMVRMPMWISGNRVRMGASVGISVAPQDGTDAETIINAADESMYAAKQGGKNAYRFYS